MEFRVDELAATCEVTVDTVRYYQSRGLIPAPRKQGRVAIYGPDHVERLHQIRSLQTRGLSLRVIGRVLAGELDPADLGLAEAVAAARVGPDDPALTIDQLAERSGVPGSLLAAVEEAGLLIGREVAGETRYTGTDLEVVRHGLRLLEAGFPLQDLLGLATRYDVAARAIASEAIELFDAHVRTPILTRAQTLEAAGMELVAAFDTLLPAVTGLISHHFRRVLLELAEERFTEDDA